jgi:integrase
MGRASTGYIRDLNKGLPRGEKKHPLPYRARVTRPNGKRIVKSFQTKADAQAWVNARLVENNDGTWQKVVTDATVNVTFADFAERWLTNRKVKGRSIKPRTRAGYRDLLNRFILPDFGRKAVHLIDREAVESWYDRTAVDTPTYRARAYSLLRTILHAAVEDGHLATNPARIRGAGQTERKHTVRPATLEELKDLTDAMPPRYQLLVQLGAWCALRFGELTELRRADVDTREGVLRVRRAVSLVDGVFVVDTPKTAAGMRDVVIPPHLMPAVRQHLLEHTAPGLDGLLFPARGDAAEHLRQSSLARVFYPARTKAGRPDLRFHDLRHTGAVYAAMAGATLAELMGRLGHSTSSAALRYQHAAQGRDAVIAARLSDLATGTGQG